jgi:cytochrome c
MKLKLAHAGLVAGLMIAVAPTIAFAEGDAKKGEKVFKKCKACHTVKKEKNKVGPHLVGIFGRAAGSIEGYKYSKGDGKGMIAKAAEIGAWDEEKLEMFLTNPKKYLGGKSKMTFRLKKEKQRANVIAYLKSLAK